MKTDGVAFQGAHGAYSEEAIRQHFGAKRDTVPCRTISEVFNLVETGEVKYGVVPVENSTEGSVNETYDSLITTSTKIAGEIVLRVVHCLVALPSTSISDVKVVYSHPQALAQCRGFLASMGAELNVSYDTAGSVEMIRDDGRRDAAAVASKAAAQIYGMSVLKEGIEDNGHNYTRFLVIMTEESERSTESKTSVIFSAPHTPGSLYTALEAFARQGVNLTKIESRPTRQRPWEYYFFLDFEGHRDAVTQKEALHDLAKRATFLKVLGSYPKAKVEQTSGA
ncbi:MAG: prephenate dehydratase [Nitrososphaerota archaeon]|nr:prephenate dehydratase [Nitrososphaerota archaeon]